MGPIVKSSESAGNSVLYSSVMLEGHEYHVGDSAYFDPDSFSFNVRHPPAMNKSKHEHSDIKLVFVFPALILYTHLLFLELFCSIISCSALK